MYFNVFGPHEGHKGEMRSVVHTAFEQIRETGKVRLFKSAHPAYRDGEQHRDFLYVKDAADATIHLAFNPEANGLFNVGSGCASTWIELVQHIFRGLCLPVNIEFIGLPESLREKYQYYTRAVISRCVQPAGPDLNSLWKKPYRITWAGISFLGGLWSLVPKSAKRCFHE